MTALSNDRNTPRRENRDVESHPIKGGSTIFGGSLVCLNAAGLAIAGITALGLTAVGRAEHRRSAVVDGDTNVRTRRGVLQFANSAAGDAITRADIGKPAYVVDDQTLAKTNGGGTRSAAGTIRDVDAQGVWIEL